MLVTPLEILALDIDGVLTDGRVALTPDGEESKGLAFRDLDAIGRARQAGIRVALVTGEDGPMVDVVAGRVGADAVLRAAKDKPAAIRDLAERLQTTPGRVCFVGDADRDAPAFDCVGLGLAPADASPVARSRAHRVLSSRGGSGAVAEAVSLLLDTIEDARASAALDERLERIAEESLAAHRRFLHESPPALRRVAMTFVRAIRSGNKILLCGNGGSAADAQHVAAELVGRFRRDRLPWPAISLAADPSVLTAVGNDWSFGDVFARQVRALARGGDVVVGISTSGGSENVVRALRAGRRAGAATVGFTGRDGGAVARECDVCFTAPAEATPRVQELHVLAWHAVCEIVEAVLVEEAA